MTDLSLSPLDQIKTAKANLEAIIAEKAAMEARLKAEQDALSALMAEAREGAIKEYASDVYETLAGNDWPLIEFTKALNLLNGKTPRTRTVTHYKNPEGGTFTLQGRLQPWLATKMTDLGITDRDAIVAYIKANYEVVTP